MATWGQQRSAAGVCGHPAAVLQSTGGVWPPSGRATQQPGEGGHLGAVPHITRGVATQREQPTVPSGMATQQQCRAASGGWWPPGGSATWLPGVLTGLPCRLPHLHHHGVGDVALHHQRVVRAAKTARAVRQLPHAAHHLDAPPAGLAHGLHNPARAVRAHARAGTCTCSVGTCLDGCAHACLRAHACVQHKLFLCDHAHTLTQGGCLHARGGRRWRLEKTTAQHTHHRCRPSSSMHAVAGDHRRQTSIHLHTLPRCRGPLAPHPWQPEKLAASVRFATMPCWTVLGPCWGA